MLYHAEDELKNLIDKNKNQEIQLKDLYPALVMMTKLMHTLFNQSGFRLQLSLKDYLSAIIKADTMSYERMSKKLELKDVDLKESLETEKFSSPELLQLAQGNTDFYQKSFPEVFKDKEQAFNEKYIKKVKEILIAYIQEIVEQLESEKDKFFLRDPAYWKAKAEMEEIRKYSSQEKLSKEEEEALRKEAVSDEENEDEENEDDYLYLNLS